MPAGKYLNIIRLCEQQVPPAAEETLAKLHFTPLPGSAAQGSGGVSAAAAAAGSPVYLAGVQEALAAAAGALLSLLRGPRVRLLDWLHSLKHAFLLDQVRYECMSLRNITSIRQAYTPTVTPTYTPTYTPTHITALSLR